MAAVLGPSCGSGNGDLTQSLGILLSDYQVLDLTTGSLESRQVIGDLLTNPVYRTTKMVFRTLGPGSSQRGSAVGSFGAQADEVFGTATVGKYYLGVFEVTQAQWTLIAGPASTPWTNSGVASTVGATATDGQKPAFALSRDVITAALASASGTLEHSLDLPTDDQWEFACRAGSTTTFSWGDLGATPATTAGGFAVVVETAQGQLGPAVVGSLLPNAFGLYDMHGNVWEWTKNGNGTIRGGSWRDTLAQARSANKAFLDRTTGHALVGARLVLTP